MFCGSEFASGIAAAQDSASNELADIIVTARKREESLQSVPVVETAISQLQIERYQTQDLKDVATQVPGLSFGDQVLSIGTQVSLRGVGTSTLDAGVDQSVSLNLDGLQLSNGLAYSAGLFDLAQIEVLKGPQALFYGKNSPGGVISLRTADPTDQFEIIGRGGHEFEADENRGELIISGPVNDQLGLRLAAMYDHEGGDFNNLAIPDTATGAAAPATRDDFPEENWVIRGTALYKPVEEFDARLKINITHDRILGGPEGQLVSCPQGVGPVPGTGIPFEGGGVQCGISHNIWVVDLAPSAFPGILNNGEPFVLTDQHFGTLEMNYRPRPDITFTSMTGYYFLTSDSMINGTESNFAAPALAAENFFDRHEWTEELRANSDFSGPLNFSAGTFYQRAKVRNIVDLPGNTDYGLPASLSYGEHNLDIESESVYGQARWAIIPTLELDAGARWTHEIRSDTPYALGGGAPVLVHLAVPEIHSDNVSPEVTLNYRPTDDQTYFASFKEGFKSGSFTITTPVSDGTNNSFGDEKAKGGEIGTKLRFFDRQLTMDAALYDYRYTGLQVGANSVAAGGLPIETTVNAGAALVYGLDYDIAYRPKQIAGLETHAALERNQARFETLNNVPCYGGQTIAAGCNELLNPATGLYTSQNLSGIPLVRAPNWQVNWGLSYEVPISGNNTIVLASDTQFSTRYLTNLGTRLDYYQASFYKTDLSVALQGPNKHWEVALIGKNLNDALTTGTCTNLNHSNGQILGGQVTGGTATGPAGIDEVTCFVDRGRELWLRFTVRPF
jgi:iron complex outermembrane recepter protein